MSRDMKALSQNAQYASSRPAIRSKERNLMSKKSFLFSQSLCWHVQSTGKRHALKVLRETYPAHREELMREADILSKLQKNQVVKLIRRDVERSNGVQSLVNSSPRSLDSGAARELRQMGFATTSPLMNASCLLQLRLAHPENAKGLGDAEFLILFGDLREGISYLRSMGVIHRDIKPGNILRDILPSGKSQYKLSDFGTSSQIIDTDQKCPLVGTEEYLHPVLYKNAFFCSGTERSLKPTSGELWSLGCTLVHAITGNVPFRPIGGARNNRKAMLTMISKKPTGAISGVQATDGKFRWLKELPSDCQMSESLRGKVTPLLQNLLETDVTKQWSFETFLDESERILAMRKFDVCDTENGYMFLMYMHPMESMAEFQDALAYYTELPAANQLVFYRVQPLQALLSGLAQVKDLPQTDPDQPLLLLSRQATEGRCRAQNPASPDPLQRDATLDEDYTAAFRTCSQLYVLSVMAVSLQRLPNVLFSAILALRSSLTSTLSTVETRFRVLSATCQERQTRLVMLGQMMDAIGLTDRSAQLKQAKDICDKLRSDLWKLKYQLDEMRKTSDPLRLDNPLADFSTSESCDNLQYTYKNAKEIWLRIQERRHRIPLLEMEQAKHKGDKDTLNMLCAESSVHIQSVMLRKQKLTEEFTSNKRKLSERIDLSQAVESQLLKHRHQSEKLSSLLSEVWKTACKDLRRMADSSHTSVQKSAKDIQAQLADLMGEDLPALETLQLDTQADSH
ncbi:hypothetical protein BaRGS_00005300 [Batillaria attramentaria]|uniref:Protein kinase domain-containing protein n=1 Tax=Batillaria attramentaria TaxID=370345 RepID=A0ABD0LWG1_9CAEN